MELTARQKEILLHMTGLDRNHEPSRRHFATDSGDLEWHTLQGLVGLGLVKPPVQGGPAFGTLWFFYASDLGVMVARLLRAEAPGVRDALGTGRPRPRPAAQEPGGPPSWR